MGQVVGPGATNPTEVSPWLAPVFAVVSPRVYRTHHTVVQPAFKLRQCPGTRALHAPAGHVCLTLLARDKHALLAPQRPHRMDPPGTPTQVVTFCQEKGVGLVVVGPEVPLVAGLADDLQAAGVPTWGPSAKAAQLEGSKAFMKVGKRTAA